MNWSSSFLYYIVVKKLNARILDNLWNSVQVQKKEFCSTFLEFVFL